MLVIFPIRIKRALRISLAEAVSSQLNWPFRFFRDVFPRWEDEKRPRRRFSDFSRRRAWNWPVWQIGSIHNIIFAERKYFCVYISKDIRSSLGLFSGWIIISKKNIDKAWSDVFIKINIIYIFYE